MTSASINRPFLRNVVQRLDATPRTILDIGCGDGRHALHFARLGHRVIGLSNEAGDIRMANHHVVLLNERLYQSNPLKCSFIHADARELRTALAEVRQQDETLPVQFNVILATDVLHMMPKADSRSVIDQAKAITAPAGMNAISGYLVDPKLSTSKSRDQMFEAGELCAAYSDDPDWQIVDYREDAFSATLRRGREFVQSHAGIIAIRQPNIPASPDTW